MMNGLPLAERRQIHLVRQQARQAMLDRLVESSPPAPPARPFHARHRHWIVRALAVAALVGAGVAVAQAVSFEPPSSLLEALLPRL
jgi:hypothetical protein